MANLLKTTDGVEFLRTPDAAFTDLPGYDHPPCYLTFEGLRLHYVDVGPRDGPVVLLMHGMPTWGFLNRHILDGLSAAGYRCIAADHLGFGRSDKPVDDAWYSVACHARAHRALIEALDLNDITLFCQDWGGPIGLAQVVDMPQRFSRLVIMNTWMHHAGYAYTDAIRRWNAQWREGGLFVSHVPERLSLGWFMMVSLGHMTAADLFAIVGQGTYPILSPAAEMVRRGYDAPFEGLGRAGHAGPRRFPLSIPLGADPGETGRTQAHQFEALQGWTKPIHFIWGGADNIFTEAWGRAWAGRYPRASFDLLADAGHFLQDTHGAEIAKIFLERSA